MPVNLEKRVFFPLLLVASLLAVTGALSMQSKSKLAENARLVTHTYEVLKELQRLASFLSETSSTHRGFLLTGKPDFLAAHNTATSSALESLGRIRQLTADNSAQQRRLNEMEPLVRLRLRLMNEQIHVRPVLGFSPAGLDELFSHEESVSAKLDACFITIQEAERSLLGAREEEALQRARKTTELILTSCVLGISALVAALVLLHRRQAGRLQAQEQFRKVLEAAPDAMLMVDGDGRMILVNAQVEREFGYRREDLLGQPVEMLLPERFRAAHFVHRAAYAAAPRSRPMGTGLDLYALRRNGSEFPIEISLSPVESEAGRFVIAAIRDVSERRRADEALRSSRAQLQAILDNASSCIYAFDLAGNFLVANRALEKLLRRPLDQIVGRNLRELWPAEFAAVYIANNQRVLSTGNTIELEETVPLEDGLHTYLSIRFPLPGPKGELIAVGGISTEITERKAFEVKLTYLSSIIESTDVVVISKSLDGTILSWNSGATRTFGYSAEEAVGRNISLLVPENHRDEVPAILSRIRAGERIQQFQTMRRTKSGELIDVSLTISPIIDATGKIVAASSLARDISAECRATRALEELNIELVQRTADLTFANQELEAFTYSVSHDLRAPVRHIDGFCRILLHEYASAFDSGAGKYLEKIHVAATHMNQLLEGLLDLSRTGQAVLRLATTRLEDLVHAIIEDLRTETEGRKVEWRIGPLPVVDCDPMLMKQVFYNLLANALKFTRTRTEACIEVCMLEGENSAFFVRDNGVGFDPRYVSKLFGAFQRLHLQEEFEGAGIGLALVQRILRKHGWHITAEASLGKGATFTIRTQHTTPSPDTFQTTFLGGEPV